MLQFYNGHFGHHPWFWFLLFNLLLREKARKLAHYFVKKNSFLNDLSLEDLEQQLHNDDLTLNNIVHQGSSLNGTWPFWHIKGSQLLAQARCLPHLSPIFVTFSCADHQWEDLQHHLPHFDRWKHGTDAERKKLAWQNIQDNPHIITAWLVIRFQAFY